MTASIVYSSLYNSDGTPLAGRPVNSAQAADLDVVSYTVATTSSDEAGDVVHLIPVPTGKRIAALAWRGDALDSDGALDMDIVLRTTDSDGNHTDTILYNAGTAFAGALSNQFRVINLVQVPTDGDNVGSIALYVNTGGGSADAGDINLIAFWR